MRLFDGNQTIDNYQENNFSQEAFNAYGVPHMDLLEKVKVPINYDIEVIFYPKECRDSESHMGLTRYVLW